MLWGQEWKILLFLELKIAQGSRVRNLTHQAGGLGTEQQASCPHQEARQSSWGPEVGPWAYPWFP